MSSDVQNTVDTLSTCLQNRLSEATLRCSTAILDLVSVPRELAFFWSVLDPVKQNGGAQSLRDGKRVFYPFCNYIMLIEMVRKDYEDSYRVIY